MVIIVYMLCWKFVWFLWFLFGMLKYEYGTVNNILFYAQKKIWIDWKVYQLVWSHWFCINDAIPGESVSLVVDQDKHLQFVNRSQHCLKVVKSCRPKMTNFEEKGQEMTRRLAETPPICQLDSTLSKIIPFLHQYWSEIDFWNMWEVCQDIHVVLHILVLETGIIKTNHHCRKSLHLR